MIDLDITCIEFSEGIKRRSLDLGFENALLLSPEIKQIVQAVRRSGSFLQMAKRHQQVTDDSTKEEREAIISEALQTERENQSILATAGITDDTTANQWLTPIEEKLKIARSEYQKLSDRHLAEMEDFCKQWMVTNG